MAVHKSVLSGQNLVMNGQFPHKKIDQPQASLFSRKLDLPLIIDLFKKDPSFLLLSRRIPARHAHHTHIAVDLARAEFLPDHTLSAVVRRRQKLRFIIILIRQFPSITDGVRRLYCLSIRHRRLPDHFFLCCRPVDQRQHCCGHDQQHG